MDYIYGKRYLYYRERREGIMKILKRYKGEDIWEETTDEECIKRTEDTGYWKTGTVLDMLEKGRK